MELIETKLTAPLEPAKLLNRPRLLALIPRIREVKLTLVQAPAGYGKSSLLAQWHDTLRAEGEQVGWISIDASDNDPSGMLSYIATALGRANPRLRDVASRLRQNVQYLPSTLMVQGLVNGISECAASTFLFFDDVHLAEPEALAALRRLLELAPPTLHCVLASRTIPDFPLARMRAGGELLELGVEDLTFTADETQRFLRNSGHADLRREDADVLASRTDGWITGIKLAGLAWRREESAQQFFSSFAGTRRSVADYFLEEVLAAQPADVQSFLLATSILDRLTPALCNAVVQCRNAREMLDRIEASGLFLLKLDEEKSWYRYHHLFSDFLRRYLYGRDPDAERILYTRAGAWCYDNGHFTDAIEYALKVRDVERAAQILDERSQHLTHEGSIRVVVRYAKQIPMAVLRRHPKVLLTWAWLRTYKLRFEESRRLLATVRAQLDEFDNDADPGTARELRGMLLHGEMSLAAAEDDASRVETLCEQLIASYYDHIPPYLSATIHSLLLYAQREQYKFTEAEALAAKSRGASSRSDYPLSQIVHHANVGPSLFLAGKADAARRTLEDGVVEAIRLGGPSFALAALPALPLAEILYERNELDRAQELLTDTLPAATVFGFADQLVSGYVTQARLHATRNELDAAYAVLDSGMAVACDRNLERVRIALVAERIRLLLQHAIDPDQAVRYARSAGVYGPLQSALPSARSRTFDEARSIALVRIALKQDRLADATQLAKQWRAFASSRGATLLAVRWNILLAQIQLLGGEMRSAQRTLREAVAQAAPARLVRSFLDEGMIIQTLLESSAEVEQVPNHPTDLFAAELLDAFSPRARPDTSIAIEQPPAEGLYGKLTGKELEILSLVGAGMRNAEIALKLGMTEGSIKWYLQQIYDKVGTRRRMQAVERARQLSLLA